MGTVTEKDRHVKVNTETMKVEDFSLPVYFMHDTLPDPVLDRLLGEIIDGVRQRPFVRVGLWRRPA